MDREIFGVSIARWALAGAGLVAGLVALIGALTGQAAAGWCLRSAPAAFGHCGWCYLGVALLAAAAAPWPRMKRVGARR